MYKILIVDDEEIEREGMASLIDWERFGMTLVGTAWNGVEGLEKIRSLSPDIVLTDIKMPGMDGIQLICRVREEMPWVEFVVLSGYGEFAYTSKAMEQGIRYYLLKPCDEPQILEVLDKVKAQIERVRSQKEQERAYVSTVARLLPKAREQLFRDLLFGGAFKEEDFQLFAAEHDLQQLSVRLLAFLRESGFDLLEQFILQNILREQLGDPYVLLATYVKGQMIFMLDERAEAVEESVRMLKGELKKRDPVPIFTAVSESGRIGDASRLYGQLEELFRIGVAETVDDALLSYTFFAQERSSVDAVVDLPSIRGAEDLVSLLEEVYFTFFKMERKGYTLRQKKETADWICKAGYGKRLSPSGEGIGHELCMGTAEGELCMGTAERELFMETAMTLAACKGLMAADKERVAAGKGPITADKGLMAAGKERVTADKGPITADKGLMAAGKERVTAGKGPITTGKEQQRVREMILATYRFLDCQALNLRFLAGQVLYRNEEYLGRSFQKVMGCRYPAWLIGRRVGLAKRFL